MRNLLGLAVIGLVSSECAFGQNLLKNGNMDKTQSVQVAQNFFLPKPADWVNEGTRAITGPYEDELDSEPWAGPAPTPVTTDGSGLPSPDGCNGGDCGVFFKPFSGNTTTNGPATGHLYQDVSAIPGQTFTLTGWAGAEPNYLATQSVFAIDFLNAANAVISSSILDLVAAGLFVNNNAAFDYKKFIVSGTAPAGSVKARARISMIGATDNPAGGGQAFVVDDFELTTPLTLLSAVSRRQHAAAGTHDSNLPLTGSPGIEPRQPGTAPRVVLTFSGSLGILNCGSFTITGGTCTGVTTFGFTAAISLSPASLAKNTCLKVTASGVAGLTGDNDVTLVLHEGNVNADASVNLADLQAVKNVLLVPLSAANFTRDVTCDGSINLADLQATKNNLLISACP